MSNSFKTASLRGALWGTDDSGQTVSIDIDLVWNGVGQKERTGDHVNNGGGIYTLRYSSHGTIRDAVADGSVVVNGMDETPLSSTQGTIEREASHGIEVWR